jgi:hypothetical protein
MPTPPDFDVDKYAGWTGTELVRQVAANAGSAGAGAASELSRRLTVELRAASVKAAEQNDRLATLTKWLIGLTVALLVLASAQIVVAVAYSQ